MWRRAGDVHTNSPPREHRGDPAQCSTEMEGYDERAGVHAYYAYQSYLSYSAFCVYFAYATYCAYCCLLHIFAILRIFWILLHKCSKFIHRQPENWNTGALVCLVSVLKEYKSLKTRMCEVECMENRTYFADFALQCIFCILCIGGFTAGVKSHTGPTRVG